MVRILGPFEVGAQPLGIVARIAAAPDVVAAAVRVDRRLRHDVYSQRVAQIVQPLGHGSRTETQQIAALGPQPRDVGRTQRGRNLRRTQRHRFAVHRQPAVAHLRRAESERHGEVLSP